MVTTRKEPEAPVQDFGAAAFERPVPRISIAAFCELPDTGAVLQRAATDRRLSKAHMEVQLGGIAGAVEYFTGQATPNLLIVETRAQGDTVLKELEGLAGVCDEATKVVVVGAVNDVPLYRELIRRGISEYLVAPLDPLQVIETISGLYVKADAPPIGRVIAFAGARGGAGASTIAHNVGWCIADGLKISTAIVDLDLPFGTVGLNFNEDPGQGIADALAAPERLDDVLLDRLLIKRGEHLSLFAAPALLDREYESDSIAFETVIDQVRGATPCVIVDVPHVWTPWTRQTLASADEIVIVAVPDLASLRNAKNLVDLLKTARPNDTPPKLVLNQSGQPKRPEIPAKEFGDAIGIEPCLVLPYDPSLFGIAANNGQMLGEIQPASRAAEGMQRLAAFVTGRAVPMPEKKAKLAFLPAFLAKKAS
ncbi:MAG: AAA family ATPase [Alphaproteobacteria bacterium]